MANDRAQPTRFLVVAIAVSLLAFWAEPLVAATTTYTGVYAGGTIAPGNTVVLNNGSTVAGNVVANGTLQFNQTGSLTLSSTLSGTGTLSMKNTGTLNLTIPTTASWEAVNMDMTTSAAAGLLQIQSGTGNLSVGNRATGTLSVTGGRVSNSSGYLGRYAGSNGTSTVSSGTWANSSVLYVGYLGTGTLNVSGGSVTNTGGYLAGSTNGNGTATISGGTWANSGGLYVGFNGAAGTLNVSGGSVTSMGGSLGTSSYSQGTATISKGSWTINGDLSVGFSGTGTLNVTGGSVANSIGYVGYNPSGYGNPSGNGTAMVSNGTWANSGALYVGYRGTGTLGVLGGSVTSAGGYLGFGAGSNGTATVSSGTWANSGYLYVGSNGTGTLNVTGGSVTNTDGVLGLYAGSVGNATVSSGTWANSDSLYVGYYGTGTLTVSGGLVTVGGVLSKGSYGTINLNSRGTLQIGTGTTNGVLGVSALTNNGTLIFNLPLYHTPTYSGIISGSGSVVKQGAGTLTLSGSNSYTGGTTIMSGIIEVRPGGVIEHGDDVLTVGLSIADQGALDLTGGSVTNSIGYLGRYAGSTGTATVSGGTWANSGALYVGSSGTGTLNVTGGSVTNSIGYLGNNAGSNGTVTVSSGTWTNNGDLTVGASGTGRLTISGGLVTVGGVLSKGSYGTINLNSRGTLQIGTGGMTGELATSLLNSGTLIFNRSDDSVCSGVISGTGAVVKQGAGTLTLSGTAATANTIVVDRLLALQAGGIAIGVTGTSNLYLGYSGTGTLNIASGNITSGSAAFGLFNRSKGIATVTSGTWTNSGDVTVGGSGIGMLSMSGGLVKVGGMLSTGSYGVINLNAGGTLQIGAGGTTGVLGVTTLLNNGTLIFNRSNDSTYSGVISGSGSVVKQGTGTLTLSGSSTYSGNTSLRGGVLAIGGASAVGSGTLMLNGGILRAAVGGGSFASAVSLNANTTITGGDALTIGGNVTLNGFNTLTFTNTAQTTISGQIGQSTPSILIKQGSGELQLTGANSYTGGTFVQSGTVRINNPTGSAFGSGAVTVESGAMLTGAGSVSGAVQMNGTWAPGNSPGLVTVNSNVVLNGRLDIELGGLQRATSSTSGSGCYDAMNVSSGLAVGGSLNVVLTNAFVPAPGNAFEILRYGQLSGDFGAVNLPAFDNGLGWQRVTTGTAMTLVATPSAVNIDVAAGSKALAAAGYSSLMYATSLNKSGDGALVLNGPNALTGPTTIQQGTITLADSSALGGSTISPLAGGVLSLTPGLQTTVGGLNPNAGGLVDVVTGMVTVTKDLSATVLVTALQSGRAVGSWTGSSGITSSAAASSNGTRSVGWLDNGNGSVTFAYAAPGDSNLDWTVDILDAGNFLSFGKFDTGLPADWLEGDFNYDATVDILDAADFFATSLYDAGNYNTPAGSIAAVPEPSTLGLVGAGVAGLMAARRKRAG